MLLLDALSTYVRVVLLLEVEVAPDLGEETTWDPSGSPTRPMLLLDALSTYERVVLLLEVEVAPDLGEDTTWDPSGSPTRPMLLLDALSTYVRVVLLLEVEVAPDVGEDTTWDPSGCPTRPMLLLDALSTYVRAALPDLELAPLLERDALLMLTHFTVNLWFVHAFYNDLPRNKLNNASSHVFYACARESSLYNVYSTLFLPYR